MKYPQKKTRSQDYWWCGKEGNGHQHTTETYAKKCMGKGTGLTHKMRGARNRWLCIDWINGLSIKDLSVKYQLGSASVTSILERYVSHSVKDGDYQIWRSDWIDGYSLSDELKEQMIEKVKLMPASRLLYQEMERAIERRDHRMELKKRIAERDQWRLDNPEEHKAKQSTIRKREEKRFAEQIRRMK